MVDDLTNMMHREWHLVNSDVNNVNNSGHSHSLSRKISDNNNNHHHHHHQHQHHQSLQAPPVITTTDYSNPSSSTFMSVPKALFNRKSLDTSYDTDGAIGTSMSRHHRRSSKDYEFSASPRSSLRRSSAQSPNQLSLIPLQQRQSHGTHLTVNPSSAITQHHSDRDEEPNYGGDTRRRHIRLSRRIHQPSSSKDHGAHNNRSPVLSRHEGMFAAAASSVPPLRLIFMRHSERANQALGPDWFVKAFRTNTYKAYDQNLPMVLPKRRVEQAYEFDTPLTGLND
jgi:hypothetical protein